jgi:hypothetical protein
VVFDEESLKIPTTWGAKITGEQFKERAVLPKKPSVKQGERVAR